MHLSLTTEGLYRRATAGATLALAGAAGTALAQTAPANAGGGDLSRQTPVDLVVELGTADGHHHFRPDTIALRTGLLYRLILRNVSQAPHDFTSDWLAASVWTRRTQVTTNGPDGRSRLMAEIKGAIREIEVDPGFAAEWWFVPVQAGRFTDLRCGICAPDGRSHAEHGMTGTIIIS